MTEDPAGQRPPMGMAELDAAAATTWLSSTGLLLGLLPVALVLGLVLVALLL